VNLVVIGLGLMGQTLAIQNGMLLIMNPIIPAMNIGSKCTTPAMELGTTMMREAANHAFIVTLLLKATLTILASV